MLEGRGIELLALAFEINKKVLEMCPMPVNDYCEILKESVELEKNKGKSKEQQDVEEEIIKRIFESVFK